MKMHKVSICTSKSYDVLIGRDLLKNAGEEIKKVAPDTKKIAVIADRTVHSLYADVLISSLSSAGFEAVSYVFEPGETSKGADEFINLLEFLAKSELTRKDALVSLGGGVSGDLCGFAASVYLRGVDYIQIPTTLLSAVDSSVGGKTAINLKAGKNLVGSFYQPSLVICSIDTFDTLPKLEMQAGLCECIKYGVIKDEGLFGSISCMDYKKDMADMVKRCVEIKAEVVKEDEFDFGERQKLNFGHTAAHGIEILSDYKTNHGLAVGIGMVIAASGAAAIGFCDKSLPQKIRNALIKNGISFECPFSAKELYDHAHFDKKRAGDDINIVLPIEIGKATIHTMKMSSLLNFFKLALGEKT